MTNKPYDIQFNKEDIFRTDAQGGPERQGQTAMVIMLLWSSLTDSAIQNTACLMKESQLSLNFLELQVPMKHPIRTFRQQPERFFRFVLGRL
jgi:hypothetical protein